jgi:AAA+ superfamily predicted ATPase
MAQDLFTLVSDDFDSLACRLADCFLMPGAIEHAKTLIQSQENIPGLVVFEGLHQFDQNAIRGITSLALASDCLRRIVDAVIADGQVDEAELDLAYTLVRPIAQLYADTLDIYAHHADLPRSAVMDFLTDFTNDNGWFGAGPESEAELLGLTFSWVAAVIECDVGLFDIYPRIIERLILEVTRIGGITAAESQSLGNLKALHKRLRIVVEEAIPHANQSEKHGLRNTLRGAPVVGRPPESGEPREQVDGANGSGTEEALRQATSDLDSMIGLPSVKDEVRRLMSYLTIQQERKKHGLRESSQSLHFVFTGNPGTGKTTVARILGKIFCGFGILQTSKMVETDRSQLVGGFLGQTAIKTDEVIQSALDGVLFIDEAYTLAGDAAKFGHGDMYGEEAINTLLKRMEDHRDRLIVIAAGYPTPMETLLKSNPGLESRFTRFIRFEDYSVPDLCRIFEKFVKDHEYSLTPAARANVFALFAVEHGRRNERFGNARFVRNVYEQAVSLHSERLMSIGENINKEALVTIDGVDIPLSMAGIDQLALDLSESKWEAECPGCRKVSRVGVKFLGQRVNCKCGQKFIFPWWNLLVESAKGLPHDFRPELRPEDRHGIVSQTPAKSPNGPLPVAGGQNPVAVSTTWRPEPERGAALLQQGVAHLKRRDGKRAIACFEEAISVDWPNSNPSCRPYYTYRAAAYQLIGNESPANSCNQYNAAQQHVKVGQFQNAIGSYKRAIELDSQFLWAPNNLAWLLSTHPDRGVRDGKLGVRYAKYACDKSEWHCWSFIDTLAAAHAEMGDFANAFQTAERAIAVAPAENQPEIKRRMQLFGSKQPFRQA